MSTKGTNGSTPAPSRDQVIKEATYYAAVHGHYDTSEAAQKANLLTVSVLDMASMEKPPEGATHRFYVMINSTAYMVTRQKDGQYTVEEHDQGEQHREERELRAAVFDYGVYYLTGTGAGYMPGEDGADARKQYIKYLLEDEENYDHYDEEEQQQPESDKHPIIRDEEPFISVGAGFVEGPAQMVARQWYVQIGPAHCCHVGLLGYRADNDQPEFVGADAEYEPVEEPEEE